MFKYFGLIPLMIGLLTSQNYQSGANVYLNTTRYVVADTSRYASFWLYLINLTDTVRFIDRVQVSCGCTMATLQNAVATRAKPGSVYVGVIVDKLDTLQPVAVDVFLKDQPNTPLRCYVRKQHLTAPAK